MRLFCILYKWIPIAPNTPLVCCCHTEISFNVGSMFSMLMVALLSFGCFLSCNVCKNKRVLSDDTSMHRPLCLDLLKVSSGSKEVFPCPGGSLRSQALEDRLQPSPPPSSRCLKGEMARRILKLKKFGPLRHGWQLP